MIVRIKRKLIEHIPGIMLGLWAKKTRYKMQELLEINWQMTCRYQGYLMHQTTLPGMPSFAFVYLIKILSVRL